MLFDWLKLFKWFLEINHSVLNQCRVFSQLWHIFMRLPANQFTQFFFKFMRLIRCNLQWADSMRLCSESCRGTRSGYSSSWTRRRSRRWRVTTSRWTTCQTSSRTFQTTAGFFEISTLNFENCHFLLNCLILKIGSFLSLTVIKLDKRPINTFEWYESIMDYFYEKELIACTFKI